MGLSRRLDKLESKRPAGDAHLRALAHRAFRGDDEALSEVERINDRLSERAGHLECHPEISAAVAELPREVLVRHAVRYGLEDALPPGLSYLVPAARAANPLTEPYPHRGWSPRAGLTDEYLVTEAIRLGATHLLPPELIRMATMQQRASA